MLACADIEEGDRPAPRRRADSDPGVRRARHQRSGRRLRVRPDADDLDAAAPRGALAGRRRAATASTLHCHLKIDTGMNRLGFRHDNLARTLPEIAASRNLAIDAVYTHFATADEPEHPAFGEQRERFERVVARAAGARHHAAHPPRRQQRRAAARRARLVRLRPPRPAPLRHRAAAARGDPAAATCPVTPQPYRAREGHAPGRGDRLRAADRRRSPRRRSPSFRPATPTASIAAWPAAASCSYAADAYRSSDRCAWT